MAANKKYQMDISLNALKHLGLNLYSNVPSVLSEIVANSWDADAQNIWINIDKDKEKITIEDNGTGMSLEDINNRFLLIAYQRRKEQGEKTLGGRKPMGRKGIGKLSLLSIATEIEVHTKKDVDENAFRLRLKGIYEAIDYKQPYSPNPIQFDGVKSPHGTKIVITNFRKNISRSEKYIRRRLARRFSIVGKDDFRIIINGKEVSPEDREYYSKAQLVWILGDQSYFDSMAPLFTKAEKVIEVHKSEVTDLDIKGWIATSEKADALRDDDGHSLNNIVIMMRGKLAQEDILEELGESSVYKAYVFGEFTADYLDDDEHEDMATSSRQKLIENDDRYPPLRSSIKRLLAQVRREWNDFRGNKGISEASKIPEVEEWIKSLNFSQREIAKRLFGKIYRLPIDDDAERRRLIKHSILAFESYRYSDSLSKIENLSEDNIEALVVLFDEFNDIESSLYYQIIRERIEILRAFHNKVSADEKERIIQNHLFKNLWLLDPAWERATDPQQSMEKQFSQMFENGSAKLSDEEQKARYDIKYKMAYGRHVVVELKRPGRPMKFVEVLQQTRKYHSAMRKLLQTNGHPGEPFEIVVVLGDQMKEWDDAEQRGIDEQQLRQQNTRVIYYGELLDRAYAQYKDYIKDAENAGKIFNLLKSIDTSDTEI